MENDIKEFSTPQPFALLLINSSNLDAGDLFNINDKEYVCFGGIYLW